MRFFKRSVMSLFAALGLGILLGLLLPIGFVAGIEAVIITFLGIYCCFKKR